MRHPSTPARMAEAEKTDDVHCTRGTTELECSHGAGGKVNWCITVATCQCPLSKTYIRSVTQQSHNSRNEHLSPPNIYKNIHGSFTHNRPKLEATQMSINNMMLVSNTVGYYTAKKNELPLLNHMEESHSHNVRQRKPDAKEIICRTTNLMYQLGWAMAPRYVAKAYSGCFHDMFLDINI